MTSFVKKLVLPLTAAALLSGLPAATSFAADRAVQAALSGQKAQARAIFTPRGVWGHFRAMDSNNNWSLSYPEMDKYFTAIHVAFDANSDGIVSRPEAPKILLRYSLSGKRFPNSGMTLAMLRGQLQQLFVKLDKNGNRTLSVRELS